MTRAIAKSLLAFSLFLFFSLCRPATLPAQMLGEAPPVSLSAELYRQDDGSAVVAVTVIPKPGWNAYANPSGPKGAFVGQPTVVTARPESLALAPLYPPGKEKPDPADPESTAYIYESATPVFLPLAPGASGRLDLSVSLLMCSAASCWPAQLSAALDVTPEALAKAQTVRESSLWNDFAKAKPAPAPGPDGAAVAELGPAPLSKPEDWPLTPRYFDSAFEVGGIWKASLWAFLAGLLLNFMPCVLPVVSLKVSGVLAICARECPAKRESTLRRHNIFFSLGIVAYFSVLATLFGLFDMALGQMFQDPKVLTGMAVVLFGLSLSLFGVFHLPVIDLKAAQSLNRTGRGQAFVTGMLATLLATPCSGPFLGGVLAWTIMQPTPVIMSVFACIGIGMASPYLVFALRPSLVRFMPRPGPWMGKLEKFVGFVLLATCLYFLQMLPKQWLLPTLVVMWGAGVAAWVSGQLVTLSQPRKTRLSLHAVGLAVLGGSIWFAFGPSPVGPSWEPFKPAVLRDDMGERRMIVDFTADWCPTCKVLEKTVLTKENLAKWGLRYNTSFVRVDLTSDNPQALALLRALGSQSLPLVAIFPEGKWGYSPVVLRDLFTRKQIEEALDKAFDRGLAEKDVTPPAVGRP